MTLHDAHRLALELMEKHGLRDRSKKFYAFGWFNSVRTLGRCSDTYQKIELNAKAVLISDEASVRETILHEIAHALRGCRYGHDRQWQLTALSIGSTGARLCNDPKAIPAKYAVVCKHCGILRGSNRMLRIAKKICVPCKKAGRDVRQPHLQLLPWQEAQAQQQQQRKETLTYEN